MLKNLFKIFKKKEDPIKEAERIIEFIENNGPEDFKLLGWQKQLIYYYFMTDGLNFDNSKLKVKKHKKIKPLSKKKKLCGKICDFVITDEWVEEAKKDVKEN